MGVLPMAFSLLLPELTQQLLMGRSLLLGRGQLPLLAHELAVKLCQPLAERIFRFMLLAAVVGQILLGCLLPVLPGSALGCHLSLARRQLPAE